MPCSPDCLAGRTLAETFQRVADVYTVNLVPKAVRAEILRYLAGVPGVAWRGEVTDHAGRPGVAISADGDTAEHALILDAKTGVLLATPALQDCPGRAHHRPGAASEVGCGPGALLCFRGGIPGVRFADADCFLYGSRAKSCSQHPRPAGLTSPAGRGGSWERGG